MKHYLGICLVLITGAALIFLGLYSCTRMADRTVDHVREAFAQVFNLQPQITVNQRVVMTQTAPIAELAVVTKEELVTYGFTENEKVLSFQIPLTGKKVGAEAVYRIKAGFDLREPFRVNLDAGTHLIHATMPHAKILSVEQIGTITYHGEDSVLNRISDEDRQQILDGLNALAHTEAENSGLKTEAENQVEQRLQTLFQHNGQGIQIEWLENPSKLL